MNELLTQLLNKAQVLEIVTIGHTKLYASIKNDGFPAPVKIGKSSRWLANEVNDWISAQAAKPRPLAQAMAALEGGV